MTQAQSVRDRNASRWQPFLSRTIVCAIFVVLIAQSTAAGGDIVEESKRKQDKPTCAPSDFHYEYTECDKNGVRWRVSVPEPDFCVGGSPEAPKRAVDCNFSCGPGEYLDKDDSQQCQKCPVGTFSLGGGELFQDWTTLPEGFLLVEETAEPDYGMMDNDERPCNHSMWELKGSHIRSPGYQCIAKLVYAANLMKEGYVEFTYSLATSDTIFHVSVTNERCETSSVGNRWPDPTGEGQWKTYKLDLEAGMNVITWKTMGIGLTTLHNAKPNPVLIKEIKVMGLSFTSECTKTKPGTFVGSKGSYSYEKCPANTFSGESGASECAECNKNTQYSSPGASECTDRKPCTEFDFYQTNTPCDENNKTQLIYKWIEPRICNINIKGAVPKKPSGTPETCPPCNPGMSAFNHSTCAICPSNMFSDGTLPCQPCPPNTAPVYGIDYIRWHQLPPKMDSTCLSLSSYGCSDESGWQLAADHIHSGKGHADDVYLVLDLGLDGMRFEEGYFDGKAEELGVISFWFSMECTGNCALFFVQDDDDGSPIIEEWFGTQEKQLFRYPITKQGPVTFSWAFQKTDIGSDYSHEPTYKYRNDVAKIYSIKVTNTLGGATECKNCPRGSDVKGCIPCDPGHYIVNDTNKCVPCPANTYLRSANPYGPEACVPCGPGMQSQGGGDCYSTCHVHASGHHYELSALKGIHSVQTGASFTARGSRFFHHFNISLCGDLDGNGAAVCTENVTDMVGDFSVSTVHAFVCRSTVIPATSMNVQAISAQPISLGDRLVGITDKNSLGLLNETIFVQGENASKDLHFYYHSAWPTLACPEGRSTVLTLRCDPEASGNGTFELPTMCPSGTCDGCAFHLLWRTEHACHMCTEKDYKSIKGECVKGQQVIHYIWNEPKFCAGGNALPGHLSKKCQMEPWYNQVPWYAQASIAAFMGCVVLLVTCAMYFWKRNRKLEYKYQKLVATANGELPAAETCAIEDGDDEDDVLFEDGAKKSRKFFNKFRSKSSNDKEFLIEETDMMDMDGIELKPTRQNSNISM
ncbi:UPF0577 protein KIAA1324-like homolog isoform X2 [Asterias rubens]|uniref:UPF0577 protein KIAA1324-like homolog isoform X2 n=1 Tax=Asterias rubens TaxID=7604 RepID=UPI001455302A|nr:UPF0577 protein KIAA1324-like homolog isoform X2 [Asterias rubens]